MRKTDIFIPDVLVRLFVAADGRGRLSWSKVYSTICSPLRIRKAEARDLILQLKTAGRLSFCSRGIALHDKTGLDGGCGGFTAYYSVPKPHLTFPETYLSFPQKTFLNQLAQVQNSNVGELHTRD